MLPKLPQVNKKTEANFGIKFRHWLMENPQRTCAYELKDTRGSNTFKLREWKQEQRDFAEAIRYSEKGVLIRTEGVVGLPDYVYLKNEPSFVVIKFPQGFCIISGDLLAIDKRKTLTFEQASALSCLVID